MKKIHVLSVIMVFTAIVGFYISSGKALSLSSYYKINATCDIHDYDIGQLKKEIDTLNLLKDDLFIRKNNSKDNLGENVLDLKPINTKHETIEEFDEVNSSRAFYMKLIFSIIFCFAALYIVLSNKYDKETQQWAFSVLSLIAGVWVGSI